MRIGNRYRLETQPVETVTDAEGRMSVEWASLNCRVVDEALGMPIGLVLHVLTGQDGMKYEAVPLYTNEGAPIPEPEGGWGARYYAAAEAVWKDWNASLPRTMRLRRFIARWVEVLWTFVGVILGFASAVLLGVVQGAPGGQG